MNPKVRIVDKPMNLNMLRIVERAYLANPKSTHADLIAAGRVDLANDLAIDFQSGRLRGNVSATSLSPPDARQ